MAALFIKQIYIITIILIVLIWTASGCQVEHKVGTAGDDSAIARAFSTKASDVQVEGEGTVTRILPDDLDGSRHQRFIVRLASGQTVLIVHNIDLAPRIATLQEG